MVLLLLVWAVVCHVILNSIVHHFYTCAPEQLWQWVNLVRVLQTHRRYMAVNRLHDQFSSGATITVIVSYYSYCITIIVQWQN